MQLIFKEIHIGRIIHQRVRDTDIVMDRIVNVFGCTETEIEKMYEMKDMDSGLMLKWSKLLRYDFFRVYSQHLILYSPPASIVADSKKEESIKNIESLPRFKKNIYTKEIIDFMLELITTKEKTIRQIIDEYKIPKTTLYKWISKYKRDE